MAVTNFKTIIISDDCLGYGAYGKVCKALCDDLLCAAKLIHPTLNVRHQQGALPHQEHRLPIERFERECEFLHAMRHPNIIQYLGVCQDNATGQRALLMELMDDNLTHYLESWPQPIPYHVQVDICHDVAMALSFLHNNNITHRDLSGKNILLRMGNIRAKVTDFGMARLGDMVPQYNNMYSNTMCPGTDVYMPPEAVQEQPVYSEKIDCFSFGVVGLQIMTRLFPKPGKRHQRVEGDHRGFPGETIMVCVREVDRRRDHINRVDPNHHLLPITLDCLRDRDGERPTAKQICERVAILKETRTYKESNDREATTQQVQGSQQILEQKDAEIQQLRQQNMEKDQIIDHKNQALTERDAEIQQLRGQLDQAMQAFHVIKTKDREIAEYEAEKRILQQQLFQKEEEAVQLEQQLKYKDQRIVRNYQLAQEKLQVIAEKDREIQQLMSQLQQATLQDRPKSAAENKERLKQHINNQPGEDRREPHVEQVLKPIGQNMATAVVSQREIVSQEYVPQSSPGMGIVKLIEDIKLKWKEGDRAQRGMTRACDAVMSANENLVYFLPYSNKDTTVLKYEVETSSWSNLKSFPYKECSLAVVKDMLIVIGGRSGLHTFSNKVYQYVGHNEDGKWSTVFSAMPTERASTSATVVRGNLLVAGGENGQGLLTVVEVMDADTHQWSTVAPLPEASLSPSMVTCGKDIYTLGGRKKSTKSVYTCTMDALLLGNRRDIWRKVADTPLLDSTCVSLYGHLLAIGGTDSASRSTKDVYAFDPVADSWKSIGQMINDRHSCFAVVLPDNQVMVVGGTSSSRHQTDSVEFGVIE